MKDFVYNAQPAHVLFGSGAREGLSEEVARLELRHVLILCTPRSRALAEEMRQQLGNTCAGIFDGAVMHTPVAVTDEAMQLIDKWQIDGVVSLGGGSVIGLGKAIALRADVAQITIPTTYAGSEMTPILGETRDGAKVTQSSPRILPEVAIYDVDLTMDMPIDIAGPSGLNAIAHCVEALYAKDRNPVTTLMAKEAIRALAGGLGGIARNAQDREAREQALYGAWLSGICLGAVGMSLHHKLCHVLGGMFNLPHAQTHAIVLPHALAYNAPAIADAWESLAEVMGNADPAIALFDLSRSLGIPVALRDIGMPEAGIDEAADRALANPYWNPRGLDREAIHETIRRAWAGAPPDTTTLLVNNSPSH